MADVLSSLYSVLMVVSCVLCVCGNLLLLCVLLLNSHLRTDTSALTLSVCLSDLALGLSTIPFGVYNSLTQTRSSGCFSSGALCQGSGFIFLLLQTSSIHSLTWSTVDKFTELVFALTYPTLWTKTRTHSVLLLLWLFSLVCAALPLAGVPAVGVYVYSERRFLCSVYCSADHIVFVCVWLLLGIVVPIACMCSLYAVIVCVAQKQARRGTFMCNEQHCYYVPANAYLRSSVVMVTTSLCVLVCWLPFTSVCLYETFRGQTAAVTSALSVWLVLSSSALNPWITCLTQSRYRSAVRQIFTRFFELFPCYAPPTPPVLSQSQRPSSSSSSSSSNNNNIAVISTTKNTNNINLKDSEMKIEEITNV